MPLTKPQNLRFWREWTAIFRSRGWDAPTAERERKALLARAGFTSLTLVDPRAGFDRVLAELGRLRDDVGRTIEVENPEPGDRRRILYLILDHSRALAACLNPQPSSSAYAISIARDQFGVTTGWRTLEDLTTHQLECLLMTLSARRRHKQTAPAEPAVHPVDPVHSVHSSDPF
jgi:hypothetical protein